MAEYEGGLRSMRWFDEVLTPEEIKRDYETGYPFKDTKLENPQGFEIKLIPVEGDK